MDCPGLYDTDKSHEEICSTIFKAVAGMHPGPHAILYVIKAGRFTKEEYGTFKRLKAMFDEKIVDHMIILFTYGDELHDGVKSIEQMLEESPDGMKQVLKECGNRYIVFNNKAKDASSQNKRLIDMVRRLNENNKGPYTCPRYSEVGKEFDEEITRRLDDVVAEEFIDEEVQKQKQAGVHEGAVSSDTTETDRGTRERLLRDERVKRQISLLKKKVHDQLLAVHRNVEHERFRNVDEQHPAQRVELPRDREGAVAQPDPQKATLRSTRQLRGQTEAIVPPSDQRQATLGPRHSQRGKHSQEPIQGQHDTQFYRKWRDKNSNLIEVLKHEIMSEKKPRLVKRMYDSLKAKFTFPSSYDLSKD